MKNQFKLIIVALCCGVTVFQSCKKEENQQVPNPQKSVSTFGVRTVNGRLKFASNEQAIAKMDELSNFDSAQLANWENQVGYKSYSSFRHKAIMENYANYMKDGASAPETAFDHTMSEAYSRILNQDSEMQIGDSIVFISDNKYVVCPLLKKAELQDIKTKVSTNQKASLAGIKVFDIKTDTLNPVFQGNLKSIPINNSYQLQWVTNGREFKFVIQGRKYSPDGRAEYCELSVYMEYWRSGSWRRKSSWERAGEPIHKGYANISISAIDIWGIIHSYGPFNSSTSADNGSYAINQFLGAAGQSLVVKGGHISAWTTQFTTNKRLDVIADANGRIFH